MKLLKKPIQVYAVCREDGRFRPLAFCLEQDDVKHRVAVNGVSGCREEHPAGHKVIYYDCRVGDGDRERLVCLRYDIGEHCWCLYKA
ncbi:MAG: hypothetical protein ACOX8R_00075 [Bacillota bacterium]|jgi:hypothetical protein